TGILLVEHDMALVRQVCRYAYVLDFGKLVFQGVTAEVMASDVVGAAYLGSQAGVAGCWNCGGSQPATGPTRCCATSTSSCPTGRSWRCWGRTAPARPRSCGWRRASCGPAPGPSSSTASTPPTGRRTA